MEEVGCLWARLDPYPLSPSLILFHPPVGGIEGPSERNTTYESKLPWLSFLIWDGIDWSSSESHVETLTKESFKKFPSSLKVMFGSVKKEMISFRVNLVITKVLYNLNMRKDLSRSGPTSVSEPERASVKVTSEPVFESPNHTQPSQTTQSQQLQQYHTTTVSNNNAKFLYLKKEEYETWAMKMEYWIMNSDHNLWNIVLNGNSRKRTGRDPKGNIMISSSCCKARFGGNEESQKMKEVMQTQTLEIGVKDGSSYDSRGTSTPTHSAFISTASTNSKITYPDQSHSTTFTTASSIPSASAMLLKIGKMDLEEQKHQRQMAMPILSNANKWSELGHMLENVQGNRWIQKQDHEGEDVEIGAAQIIWIIAGADEDCYLYATGECCLMMFLMMLLNYPTWLELHNKPMWTNVANIPSFVPKAASVPAGSRNRPTSVPAGSRNKPTI
ncbi:hypothetical protein Tco_0226469 [Tanacetum coccineum]